METTRTSQDRRLRAHGERLLQALDDQETPATYAEILRAARALIAVKKALDLIRADQEEADEPAGDEEPLPPMNRRMRRMAKAMARHVMVDHDRSSLVRGHRYQSQGESEIASINDLTASTQSGA